MSAIVLCEQKSNERQKEVEILWNGITTERIMRTQREMCFTKVLNNLSEETLHKWLISLQSICSHSGLQWHSNGFIQNESTNHKSIVNSGRSQRKVVLFNKQSNESFPLESRSRNQSLHSNSTKDFAQEFHESVLLETTKQQQKSQKVVNQPITAVDSHYLDIGSTSSYNWPGIEAIMESYDRYSNDRKEEKDFLYERSHELKKRLQDINKEAEHLNQQMTNLLQTKSHLDDEKQRYESTLEALKTCLSQMR